MRAWIDARAELVADFMQYYGVALPLDDEGMDAIADGTMYGILWEQLPKESRTARRDCPDLIWGDAERLLWSIEYSLRILTWQKSKDGSKGRNRPRPLQTPMERHRNRQAADAAIAHKAEIDKVLGMV